MSRVCLFAQFDPGHRIRPHVVRYVGHLQGCGYQVVVACSGSHLPPREDRAALAATGARMVFRANRGHDFGAWAHLVREGHARGASAVLLANDSVFGPFFDLGPIIRRMDARGYDVWGMIESAQHVWHLQSWFVQFSGRAFESEAVAAVFAQDFAGMEKGAIIERGELGLGRALVAEGFRCGAVVGRAQASWVARMRPMNPMHIDWRHHLLRRRLPFIKADLLRTNLMGIPWATEWERVVGGRLGADTGEINAYLFAYSGRARGDAGEAFPVPTGKLDPVQLGFYALASRDHGTAARWLVRGVRRYLTEGKAR